jgi:CheY-like chemotaxis protein
MELGGQKPLISRRRVATFAVCKTSMSVYRPNTRTLILYADRNPDDRLLVKEALAEISPEVAMIGLPNCETLLDYLFLEDSSEIEPAAVMPDAILLEINMPKNGGVEALTAIKNNPKSSHIPVIVFSTFTNERDKSKALKLGADSVVRKPRSFRHLRTTLSEIVERLTTNALSPAYRAFPNLDTVSR